MVKLLVKYEYYLNENLLKNFIIEKELKEKVFTTNNNKSLIKLREGVLISKNDFKEIKSLNNKTLLKYHHLKYAVGEIHYNHMINDFDFNNPKDFEYSIIIKEEAYFCHLQLFNSKNEHSIYSFINYGQFGTVTQQHPNGRITGSLVVNIDKGEKI
jgi:hypothetical protein